MITKKLTLFYSATQSKVVPPPSADIQRKDEWVKSIQATSKSESEPELIKVTYEVYDPEIHNQMRFFNGTVIPYYVIQNDDITEGLPDRERLDMYREEILDQLLGYDYKTVNKTIRMRKSTTELRTVQAWNNLLQLCEETLFANAGFSFPDTEAFWKLSKEIGYENAKNESIKRLQSNLKKRYG
jgi:hypothetical protein